MQLQWLLQQLSKGQGEAGPLHRGNHTLQFCRGRRREGRVWTPKGRPVGESTDTQPGGRRDWNKETGITMVVPLLTTFRSLTLPLKAVGPRGAATRVARSYLWGQLGRRLQWRRQIFTRQLVIGSWEVRIACSCQTPQCLAQSLHGISPLD